MMIENIWFAFWSIQSGIMVMSEIYQFGLCLNLYQNFLIIKYYLFQVHFLSNNSDTGLKIISKLIIFS